MRLDTFVVQRPTMKPPTPQPTTLSTLRRLIYVTAGLFFVGLAILGVLLPLLPTTPFLLLASFCFVRSSPGLHAWLLRNRLFGPLLRDWQHHRGIRRRVKISAVVVLLLALSGSAILGASSIPFLILLAALGLVGLTVVLRLPVIADDAPTPALQPIAVEEASGSPVG